MRARIGWDSALAIRGSTRSSVGRAMTATLIERLRARDSRRARTEYDAFAPYYDAFTADSDYEAWTREVARAALRGHGLRGDTAARPRLRHRQELLPVPAARLPASPAATASTAMLAEAAAQGARRPRLVHADIRELPDARALRPRHLLRRLAQLPARMPTSPRRSPRSPPISRQGARALRPQLAAGLPDHVRAPPSERRRDGLVFAWRGASAEDALQAAAPRP